VTSASVNRMPLDSRLHGNDEKYEAMVFNFLKGFRRRSKARREAGTARFVACAVFNIR